MEKVAIVWEGRRDVVPGSWVVVGGFGGEAIVVYLVVFTESFSRMKRNLV